MIKSVYMDKFLSVILTALEKHGLSFLLLGLAVYYFWNEVTNLQAQIIRLQGLLLECVGKSINNLKQIQ